MLKIGQPTLSPFSLTVSFIVTNTGNVTGSESSQVYITLPPNGLTTPKLQLHGFQKVRDLKPGQSREVNVQLDKYAVSFWDITVTSGAWRAKEGMYSISVGTSSAEISLTGEFELKEGFVWDGL